MRTHLGHNPQSLLARFVRVEANEVAGLIWSFVYFFAVLCAYYIVRPVRDEMSVTVGSEGLQHLFIVVLIVMVAAVPLFGWVASSFPRRRIVPVIYGFFIANLLIFWLLLNSRAYGALVAGAFFVWVSVFNLFAVSLFWITMSDLWHSGQAKRLYGFIAAGGSAGALAGPIITQSLVTTIGTSNLLLVSALVLTGATAAAMWLRRLFAAEHQRSEGSPVGKGLFAGAVAVWRSPFLFRIAVWILLSNLVGTLFYLEQIRIVGLALADRNERVQLFARLDLGVSALTIFSQVFLTARAMHHLGIGRTAALLPASALLALIALAVSPSLGVIATIMVMERAIAFSLANPAVKVLYTAVSPEEKYKAQNFNDTVVFRTGDALSGSVYNALTRKLGLGLGGLTVVFVPLAALWVWLAFALGRQQSEHREITKH